MPLLSDRSEGIGVRRPVFVDAGLGFLVWTLFLVGRVGLLVVHLGVVADRSECEDVVVVNSSSERPICFSVQTPINPLTFLQI